MANYNQTNTDDLEQKKWLISRIDLLHQTIIQELKSESSRYENLGQKILSTSKTRRNYYLSALGIALTVLVGVNPVYDIDVNLFSFLLIGIFVLGLIIFAIYSWAISKVEKIFNFLEDQILEELGNLAESQGFLITSMSILSNVTLQQANNFQTFSILLHYSVMIHLSKAIKKHANEYKNYPEFKRDIDDIAKSYQPSNELVSVYFERLDTTQHLPKNLIEFIEKNLKPIIDKQKSKNKENKVS